MLSLAQTGEQAVKLSKTINAYKSTDQVGDVLMGKRGDVRSVEGKTFYLKEGFWTDSTYDETKSPKPEVVTFGSKRYFELATSNPQLAKYLAVGQQVIVVHEGHCYKIVSP